MRTAPSRLYVIEEQNEFNGQWEPQIHASRRTRRGARESKAQIVRSDWDRKCRIAIYERVVTTR